jgi:hypothetical protein
MQEKPLELIIPRIDPGSSNGGLCASLTEVIKMILRPLCGEARLPTAIPRTIRREDYIL